MRVLIIVLLLVLTPMRGWAADSMAVQMATQGLGSTPQAEESSPAAPAIHCPSMEEHRAEAPTAYAEDAGDADSPCNNCAACQMCATVALIAQPLISTIHPHVHHLPWAAVPAFSNAELVVGQKPPIS